MAADTRDRILDALEKLLLVSGVAQVTLEGVAAEAGVSKGGLLYHFPSKEALLAAMVRRLGERSDQQLEDAVAAVRRSPSSIYRFPMPTKAKNSPSSAPSLPRSERSTDNTTKSRRLSHM
ncbi:hypothetical protein GCM10020255_087930 [Rhodococcus baikonurensis]